MPGLTLLTPPTIFPCTTAQCKLEARVPSADTSQDAWFTTTIKAASEMIEQHLNRSLLTQTWQYWLNTIPAGGDFSDWKLANGWPYSLNAPGEGSIIELPKAPLQSVTSVLTYNDAGTESTFSTASYNVSITGADGSNRGNINLVSGAVWPSDLRDVDAMKITFKSGYGDAASAVPGAITTACTRMVANMYEHRGDDMDSVMDKVTKNMLAPYAVPAL